MLPPLLLLACLALAAAPPAAGQAPPATVDLVLDLRDFDDPVQEGDIVTYSINVTNRGSVEATDVVARLDVPDSAVWEYGAPGCGPEGDDIVCRVARVTPGGGFGYSVGVRYYAAGEMIVRGSVSSAQADLNEADNVDLETTTVTPAPLDMPPDLTCVAQEDGIRLTWGEVEGATEYQLIRADARGVANAFFRLEGTTYFDAAATPHATHHYRVWAIGPEGESSPPTRWCEVTAIPEFPSLAAAVAAGLVALAGFVLIGRRRLR